MKNNLKTRIAIVLDCSGSMSDVRKETVSAFNEQVQTIKKNSKEVDTTVSLVTFSSIAHYPLIWNKSAKDLKKLDLDAYNPSGGTAMYDAVGQAINNLLLLPEAHDPNTSFLVIVISDGMENSSKMYNTHTISQQIRQLQASNRWTFTYLGANQDLGKVSADLGIYASNMMNFQASPQGVKYASAVNAGATQAYLGGRAAGASCSTNFYSEGNSAGPITPEIQESALFPNKGKKK